MALYLAEIWVGGPVPGPTGRFARVLEGEIQDHGGNVLFSGEADACSLRARHYRILVLLVPTRWEEHGDTNSEEPLWQPIVS